MKGVGTECARGGLCAMKNAASAKNLNAKASEFRTIVISMAAKENILFAAIFRSVLHFDGKLENV